eukprot:10396195-Lingulodinium_polyedra.AAC.1
MQSLTKDGQDKVKYINTRNNATYFATKCFIADLTHSHLDSIGVHLAIGQDTFCARAVHLVCFSFFVSCGLSRRRRVVHSRLKCKDHGDFELH